MKTRTANQLELSLPTQSLKRTLAASLTEVSLDYKTIGSPQALVSPELPPKRKGFRGKQRPRSRKLAEMEELTPILGLASLLTEAEPQQARPKTPDSASSSGTEGWVLAKRRCIQPFRLPKSASKKPLPLKKFSPGALSRAATHAAIAYYIWIQKQQPVNGHTNCSILP